MPVCVECGLQLGHLYTAYSPSNLCLTKCPRCSHFADPYIEHDMVLVFIDMLLHKPAVYRHLIFNRFRLCWADHQGSDAAINGNSVNTTSAANGDDGETIRVSGDDGFMRPDGWRFYRLVFLLLLFEVYIKWSCSSALASPEPSNTSLLAFANRYLLMLAIGFGEFVLFWGTLHVCIRLTLCYTRRSVEGANLQLLPFALVVSSFAKALHILMVIWNFSASASSGATDGSLDYAHLINVAVVTSNAEALRVLCGVSYGTAYAWLAVAASVKYSVQKVVEGRIDPTLPSNLF